MPDPIILERKQPPHPSLRCPSVLFLTNLQGVLICHKCNGFIDGSATQPLEFIRLFTLFIVAIIDLFRICIFVKDYSD